LKLQTPWEARPGGDFMSRGRNFENSMPMLVASPDQLRKGGKGDLSGRQMASKASTKAEERRLERLNGKRGKEL